jgi:hypothetical protein
VEIINGSLKIERSSLLVMVVVGRGGEEGVANMVK